jgi:hypothetical protein
VAHVPVGDHLAGEQTEARQVVRGMFKHRQKTCRYTTRPDSKLTATFELMAVTSAGKIGSCSCGIAKSVSLLLPRLHNQASSFLFLDRYSNRGRDQDS